MIDYSATDRIVVQVPSCQRDLPRTTSEAGPNPSGITRMKFLTRGLPEGGTGWANLSRFPSGVHSRNQGCTAIVHSISVPRLEELMSSASIPTPKSWRPHKVSRIAWFRCAGRENEQGSVDGMTVDILICSSLWPTPHCWCWIRLTALIWVCSLVHATNYPKVLEPATSSPMTDPKDSRVDQIKSHQPLDNYPITTPRTINVQLIAWDL